MFIYKITINTTNKVYIGLDTKPEYKQSRWKQHCKDAMGNSERKIHKAMREAGLKNCNYTVIEKGYTRISELAIAEINYIKIYDSYKNGLNSSPGGDGIGYHDLTKMTNEEVELIRAALGDHWKEYNKKRWAEMSDEEKKKATEHLHNEEVYEKRSKTLKKFYEHNPKIVDEKGMCFKKWHEEHKEEACATNKINGLKGALKVSKKVITENENGEIETFISRSDFQRKTGLWFTTLVAKSKQNQYYRGYRLKN